jgi:hypothetical protein
MQSRLFCGLGCSAVLGLLLSGCGGGPANLASVTGKVTHQGQPVKGGTLLFAPSGDKKGRPAVGRIEPDGSYALETDGHQGSLVGKSTVLYTPPGPDIPADKEEVDGFDPPRGPYDQLSAKQEQVEVKEGPNTIDIELVKRSER